MIKKVFKYIGPAIGISALALSFHLFQSQILFKSHQYQLQNQSHLEAFNISNLSELKLRDEYLEFVRSVSLNGKHKSHLYHQVFTKNFQGYLEPNRLLSSQYLKNNSYKEALNEIETAIDHHPYFYANYFLKAKIQKSLNLNDKISLDTANKLLKQNQNFRELNVN